MGKMTPISACDRHIREHSRGVFRHVKMSEIQVCHIVHFTGGKKSVGVFQWLIEVN